MKYFIVMLIFFINFSATFSLGVNPDGTVKIIPYEPTQEQEMKLLVEDIKTFQNKLMEYLPYLKLQQKASENRYFEVYYEAVTWVPQNPSRYFEAESVDVKFSGSGFQNISFLMEKHGISSNTINIVEEIQVVNTTPASDTPDGIEMKVIEKGQGPPVIRVYAVPAVRDPKMRLKIIRSYRNYVFETVQRIERMQSDQINSNGVEMKNLLRKLR